MPLSAERYAERKADLAQQLEAAEQLHAETAYKIELGDADEAVLDRTGRAVDNLKLRLRQLSAAWQETQRRMDQDALAANAAARSEAAELIKRQLAQRKAKARRIVKLFGELGEALSDYRAASAKILTAAHPHLTLEQRSHLASAVQPSRTMLGNEHQLFEGHLYAIGIETDGRGREYGFRVRDSDFAARVEMQNEAALHVVNILQPDGDA